MGFRNRLAFHEMVTMINEIYDSVFDTNEDTGGITYLPELYDYAFRLSIAKYYGGIIPTGNAESDYDSAMDIIPGSMDVDQMQLRAIEYAVREKIEVKKAEMNRSNITVSSRFDEIIPMADRLVTALSEKISAIDSKKVNKQIASFNMKNLIDTYLKTEYAQNQKNSVLDAKNEEIRVLKKQLDQPC